ncbi:TadE/TadG family type IV pilus assembly protein [Brucella sp. IR073]|uniref:TadE/TadG family type IV pilus assembly protein n=1 Tax=unclassified Brucella TaxID=2632610 RepID=UPI003B97F345
MKTVLHTARKFVRRFLVREKDGASAVEFAVIAPVFVLILAGSLDLGMVIYARFKLDSAVSSGASYALTNASMVTSTQGNDLANKIAALIAARASNATASVTVNNGPNANFENGIIKASRQSQAADRCYCPTGNAQSLVWGAEKQCGAVCPDGARAGKFVAISVEQPYQPIFSGYGFIDDDTISSATVVRTE